MATTELMVSVSYVEDIVTRNQNVGTIEIICRKTITMETTMRMQITLQNMKS